MNYKTIWTFLLLKESLKLCTNKKLNQIFLTTTGPLKAKDISNDCVFAAIVLFVADGKKIRKVYQIHSIIVPYHLLGKAERLIISVRWADLPPRSDKCNIKSQYNIAALPTSKLFQVLNQEGYQQEIPWGNLLDHYKNWIPELEKNHLLESSVYLSTNVISIWMKTQKYSSKWEQQMQKGLFFFLHSDHEIICQSIPLRITLSQNSGAHYIY